MATTHQVSFQLEERTMQAIQSAVDSGRFSSPEEFVSKAIDGYQYEQFPIDEATRLELLAICERMDADPSRGIPIDDVLRHLGIDEEDEDEVQAA